MRKLSTYIDYTLMTRHYVFVPGIGGFLLRDIDASYSNNTFSPPLREVHFNRFMTKDDGMLANAYMTAEGISYDEAISQIRIEAAGLKPVLEKMQFPLDPDCYGLSPLAIRPWKEVEESRKQEASSPARASQEYISIPTTWLRRAVAVLVIAICFFANFNSSDRSSQTDYAAMFNADVLFGTASPQTVTSSSWDSSWEDEAVLAEIENSAAESESLESAEEPEPAVAAPLPEKLYYIIIASCSSRQEAERAVTNRQKQGFENIGILEMDGRFRLFLHTFASRAEGEAQLQQVRESTPFSDAWLLPVKN